LITLFYRMINYLTEETTIKQDLPSLKSRCKSIQTQVWMLEIQRLYSFDLVKKLELSNEIFYLNSDLYETRTRLIELLEFNLKAIKEKIKEFTVCSS